ncbi:hypothetical protein WDV76_05650 [Xenorhabdus griffiniae]|uniref:hypothetical protein n=1 Tax=Xenorhabdus griffiniae TaxID=351672 RepID=UPI0030D5A280
MRLVKIYSDAYIFEEPHRKAFGKNRLTIVCHGYGAEHGVVIDGRLYSPQRLSGRIPLWTSINNLHSIRLISCRTSDSHDHINGMGLMSLPPRATSFASLLSRHLNNIYIRAYTGKVAVHPCSKDAHVMSKIFGEESLERYLMRQLKIAKNEHNYHYYCVAFLNGQVVKERYQIQAIDGIEFGLL